MEKPIESELSDLPEVPSFEALLAPLSGERPTGESLRYEGTYDSIQQARRDEDDHLPRGVWEADLRRADWREVSALCSSALATRSKDLQIAVWLVEAHLHLRGLPALAGAIDFLRSLCERFWSDLHPPLSESDPEYRSAPLEWLARRLAQNLILEPVFESAATLESPFNLAEWRRLQVRHDGDKAPTTKQFLARAAGVPSDEARWLVRDARAAREATARLETAIDGFFSANDAPSLHPLREALEELEAIATHLLLQRGEEISEVEIVAATPAPDPEVSTVSEPSSEVPESAAPEHTPAPVGRITTREEAYRQLEAAARFLLRTEPHSPTPYLVMRAVAWGQMSLSELLGELVPDSGYAQSIRSVLGLDDLPRGAAGDGSHHRDED